MTRAETSREGNGFGVNYPGTVKIFNIQNYPKIIMKDSFSFML